MRARRRLEMVALAAALVACAACGPSRNDQMTDLHGLVFQLSYTNWKWYRGNGAANGKYWYSYMDWSSDGCSAPLIGNGPWDFYFPCTRHDFSWRNLKRISSVFDPDVWNGRNKNAADLQFLDDLNARCGDFPWYTEWLCHPDAAVYFAAVNALAPYASPGDAFKQGFVW